MRGPATSLWGPLLLAALAGLLAGCAPRAQVVDLADKVADLDAQNATLELLLSLQLAPDQVGRLTPLLQTAGQAREQAQAREQELLAELAGLLEQRRDALMRDEAPAQSLEASIQRVRNELRDVAALDPAAQKALADGLRAVLTAEQIEVAVGALEARIQAAEMLDGFRNLGADEFEDQIGPFARELAGPGAGMSAERVEALFREARTLSAEEYRKGQDALVRELEPLFAPSHEAADHILVRAFARRHVLELLPRAVGTPDK